MRKLFKSVGKNIWIEPDFRREFGKNITIGSNTLIGSNVGVYNANHMLDTQERIEGGLIPSNVHIGTGYGQAAMPFCYRE